MGVRLNHIMGALALIFAQGQALAAVWEPVASGRGEQMSLDTSRLSRTVEGRILAWTRLSRDKATTDPETNTTFTRLEVLSSYDCTGRQYLPVKRLYLDGEKLLRVENLYAARDLPAGSSGTDGALLANLCARKIVAQAKAGADTRPTNSEGKPGLMHAEMISEAKTGQPTMTPVVDKTAAGSAPASTATEPKADAPKRFIELPKIDKSQVEHPTDEPKAADNKPVEKSAKPAEKPVQMTAEKAMERLAAKVADTMETDRRAREMALATSGPRRTVAAAAPARKRLAEPAPESAVAEHRAIHWSYEGEGGPAAWANLDSRNALCAAGKRQSPIDINDGIKVDLESVKFSYRPTQFRIEDNGHTIQVTVGDGNTIAVMGRSYELKQFHFHRPSEERVNGRRFDMVAHLVHKDDDGNLAVVAVLLDKGASEHPLIQVLWNNMPLESGMSLSPATLIDLNTLLPESRAYYTYMGSLTTPPCSENVLWIVMKQPAVLSAEQVAIFSRLYRNNARPIQPANGRLIKESR